MKKLFTLFMLLGLFSTPALADGNEGEADATPTAASFCNDERTAKDVASLEASGTESSGEKVKKEEVED